MSLRTQQFPPSNSPDWKLPIPGMVFCRRGRGALRFGALLLSLGAFTSCSEVGESDLPSLLENESSIDSSDWSGWRHRGAGQTAAKSDTGDRELTTEHSTPLDGAEIYDHWRCQVPGGVSSPTVWADDILLTYEAPPRSRRPGSRELGVLCVTSNGGIDWRRPLAAATGPTHHKNGYAAATPATNGELVVASFGQAGIFCLSMDGQVAWHAGEHSVEHQWGHAASPLIAGGAVIQLADGQDGSFIAAYDVETGQRLWRTKRASNGCWASPVLFEHSGGNAWVVINGSGRNSGPGEITGYDPLTGKVAWSVAGTSATPAPTAVVWEDLVISASGDNGPIFAIRVDGSGRAEQVWRKQAGGPYVPTGVVVAGQFIQLDDSGRITGYDAQTGERLWTQRLPGSFTASLVALPDDHILATSENGELTFLSIREKNAEITGRHSVHNRVLATPVMMGERLLVRTVKELICLGATPHRGDPIAAQLPSRSATTQVSTSAVNYRGTSD